MFDYPALRAVAMIVQTGSFEAAAAALHVTPSAVSQRVKRLEEALGIPLIERGQPCMPTEKGAWLCRHMEQVGMLEQRILDQFPELAGPDDTGQPVTLSIAVNADSLGTWFIGAVAGYARDSGHLLNLAVEDEEHTAEWLEKGRVLAAVTAVEQLMRGCRVTPLGRMRYLATASPDFAARHFPQGVTAAALARAPALTFNHKDRLQKSWAWQVVGHEVSGPTHWLPSTQGFVDACLVGIGWALNPEQLARPHLDSGRLVEITPGAVLERPLYWQVSRLAAGQLAGLTRDLVMAARRELA